MRKAIVSPYLHSIFAGFRSPISWSGKVLLLAGILLLAGTRPVFAISGCDNALKPVPTNAGSTVFILVLDGLSLPTSMKDTLILGLRSRLEKNIETLELSQDNPNTNLITRTRFNVVPCPKRIPSSPDDISSEAPDFLENRVILELWGHFDGDEAILSHAILPYYVHGASPHLSPGEVFDSSFPYRVNTAVGGQTSTQSELSFLKKIMLESLPLRAYVAAGAAALSHQRKNYDTARRYYCDSRQFIYDLESEQTRLSSKDKRLLQHVESMALEVIKAANDDSQYEGLLGTSVPVGTKCDGQQL